MSGNQWRLSVEAELSDGFGTSIAVAGLDGLWIAATTNMANLWHRETLVQIVHVSGYVDGRPGFSTHDGAVRVGEYTIDTTTGEVLNRLASRRWLTQTLDDDGSVTDADFTTPTFVHITDNPHAVVLSRYSRPRGRTVPRAFSGPESQLLLIDTTRGELVAELVHDAAHHSGLVDASSDLIAAAARRDVRTWSPTTGEAIASWSCDALIDAIAVAPASREVATLDRSGEVAVWDGDGSIVRRWLAHDGPGAALAWAPSGDWIAVGARDGRVSIWTTSGRQPERRGEFRCKSVGGLAAGPSPDGLIVAGDVVNRGLTLLSIRS